MFQDVFSIMQWAFLFDFLFAFKIPALYNHIPISIPALTRL